MHQTTMKTKGRQLHRACKTRWLSTEAAVRARSEISTIRATLKQLSANTNDAMCAVLMRLKNTMSTWCFRFVVLAPCLTELSKIFQTVCFDLAQVKTSVELCINKFSDATAKAELIANRLIVN